MLRSTRMPSRGGRQTMACPAGSIHGHQTMAWPAGRTEMARRSRSGRSSWAGWASQARALACRARAMAGMYRPWTRWASQICRHPSSAKRLRFASRYPSGSSAKRLPETWCPSHICREAEAAGSRPGSASGRSASGSPPCTCGGERRSEAPSPGMSNTAQPRHVKKAEHWPDDKPSQG